jgi:hypothetical protein
MKPFGGILRRKALDSHLRRDLRRSAEIKGVTTRLALAAVK